MSKRALRWFAMEADRLSPSAHVVFYRLCLMHEDHRAQVAFLSKSFARARRAQLDPKTVYAALDELESLGLIRRERTTVWLAVPLNYEVLEGPKNGPFGAESDGKGPKNGPFGVPAEIGDMFFAKGPKNGTQSSEKRHSKVQKTDRHLIQTEEQVLGPAPPPVDNLAQRLARCAVSAEAGMPWQNPITGHWEQPQDFAWKSAELLERSNQNG